MATHTLTIKYDDAAGTVAAEHRCAVPLAGQLISHARPVELAGDVATALKAFVDENRELMEREATALALPHAAAAAGRVRPGVTPLAVGGSLGTLGAAAAQKE